MPTTGVQGQGVICLCLFNKKKKKNCSMEFEIFRPSEIRTLNPYKSKFNFALHIPKCLKQTTVIINLV